MGRGATAVQRGPAGAARGPPSLAGAPVQDCGGCPRPIPGATLTPQMRRPSHFRVPHRLPSCCTSLVSAPIIISPFFHYLVACAASPAAAKPHVGSCWEQGSAEPFPPCIWCSTLHCRCRGLRTPRLRRLPSRTPRTRWPLLPRSSHPSCPTACPPACLPVPPIWSGF